MGIFFLILVYWATVVILFLIGLGGLIVKRNRNESHKTYLKLLIGSVIAAVIGFGACAAILFSLG